MNKVTRLLGSAVLATGLTLGSSVTAGAAFADNNSHDRGYGATKYDDRNDNRDRSDRHRDDRDRGYGRVVYVEHDHRGDCHGKYHRAWFEDRYGHIFVIVILVR
ncbi:hypothetical protein OVA06_10675 [Pseudarthrobacter sp. SL88]|uniref:hypothetical protein n=1 Tax=Micrococcaceae TaxID=1268 RepID=UPI0006FE8919|nr:MULTISPECIES: hypothetical protein [Micrococcaceae]KQQ89518.1 hypothetical protein ASF64_17935 [Arthrobacter sp. Leaf137]MCY1675164.1 hypothetical protein [Pseudarthrobacter sp. SL88]MDQ1052339.1 hypothetical protein [Arthrobacter sp. SORGH_AS_0212]